MLVSSSGPHVEQKNNAIFFYISYFKGTMLFYKPGLLTGGSVDHECNPQRSIGYYLEAVVLLAPFCKKPIRLTLRGITNDRHDPMVCQK